MPAVSTNPWLYHNFIQLEVGDVDGDQCKDLLFVEEGFSGLNWSHHVMVLRGVGARSFASNFVKDHAMAQRFQIVTADYDGDGDTDAVVLPGYPWTLELLLSRGALGSGCSGTPGMAPVLWTGDATLGGSLSLAIGAALPVAPSALGVSLAPAIGTAPCTLLIDPASLVLPTAAGLGIMMTDVSGTASFSLPLPVEPALQGVALFHQWAVLDPGGGLVFPGGSLALTPGRAVVLY
jgi:hypothetical protein